MLVIGVNFAWSLAYDLAIWLLFVNAKALKSISHHFVSERPIFIENVHQSKGDGGCGH